jgi:UTP--glucose-1-phosphate uridylyltransferase
MPITKAIFCVAGFGTRFLPATKAQPKEMLPIVDKPIIQYLVEEAVQAGIKEIIFVTGRGKNSIENHFDKSFELESSLVEKGKHKLVDDVDKISKLANFAYVRQPIQKGDGHALLCAKPFIDPTETVLVIFPDYLMPAKNHTLSKMIDIYREHRQPVIAADTVSDEKTHLYGVMAFEETGIDNIVKVKEFVEKPKQGTAPSNLINAGYYIITPEVMNELSLSEGTAGDGEIRVADAFVKLTKKGHDIYALKPDQQGYDCGDKIGFLKATVDIALDREDLKIEFMEFLKKRINN